MIRAFFFTVFLLAALFVPADVFAASLIPAEPPVLSKAEWAMLVGAGAGIVFGLVAAVREHYPSIDGRLIYALIVPITLMVAVYQVGFSELELTAKQAGAIFVLVVGGTAGVRKYIGWSAASAVAVATGKPVPQVPSISDVKVELLRSDGTSEVIEGEVIEVPEENLAKGKPSKFVPPMPVLFCIALALACIGCASPLQGFIATADAAAVAGDTARPVLRELCVEPMNKLVLVYEAAKAKSDDRAAGLAQAEGKALAKSCDPAIDAQALLLKTHAAMRAAILAFHAGKAPPGIQEVLLELVAAGAKLAKSLSALKGGGL